LDEDITEPGEEQVLI